MTVSITSPTDGATLTSNTVSIAGTVNGKGPGSVDIYSGEDTVSTQTVGDSSQEIQSFTASVSLPDGEHDIWATYKPDGDGDSEDSPSITVTVSGQPEPSPAAQTPDPDAPEAPAPPPQPDASGAPEQAAEPSDASSPAPESPNSGSVPATGPADQTAPSSAARAQDPPDVAAIVQPNLGVDTPATETAIKAANGGVTDTATSNEGDQPADYVPPEPGPGAPDAPVITAPEDGKEVSGRIAVSGTATSGNLALLELDGQPYPNLAAAAISDGTFRFVVSLEPGEHKLTVRQRSAAGDTSDPSDEVTVNVVPVPDMPGEDDPDGRLAHFFAHQVLGEARLGYELFVELQQRAQEWLASKGL